MLLKKISNPEEFKVRDPVENPLSKIEVDKVEEDLIETNLKDPQNLFKKHVNFLMYVVNKLYCYQLKIKKFLNLINPYI